MRKAARALLAVPVGFDEPIEMLLACHRRIERQLETLQRLAARLAQHGVDAEASAAAQAILQYFRKAAFDHHDDEERDLLPLLDARIQGSEDRARFHALREALVSDHRILESAWGRLRKPLEGIAEGLTRTLPLAEVREFQAGYARHIAQEESALVALADRWLDAKDRETLGRSMAARRAPPQPR
jgi:pyridoxamine 5'-phosphate oxidase